MLVVKTPGQRDIRFFQRPDLDTHARSEVESRVKGFKPAPGQIGMSKLLKDFGRGA